MKIYPKDPDLRSIFLRIKEKEIELQPDFQRDLVWNKAKKQSLVDTILRDWQFPPIFLVIPSVGNSLDVLDGQQRLNAIYEFFSDMIPIDGKIPPYNSDINKLDGMFFSQLPADIKSRVSRYSIRVFELSDYNEDEPNELFFRLNQGTSLTPAEKRNTFYGPARDQVRALVLLMQELELDINRIGFNNNRLSYHDVIARFIYLLETQEFNKKITDKHLVTMYRSGDPVSDCTMEMARASIKRLSEILASKVRFNKPTLFTWLTLLAFDSVSSEFLYSFEELKRKVKEQPDSNDVLMFLINLYHEKSSSSVNDAVAVQIRLLVLFVASIQFGENLTSSRGLLAKSIFEKFKTSVLYTEENLVNIMRSTEW